jgi:hypothetical protein
LSGSFAADPKILGIFATVAMRTLTDTPGTSEFTTSTAVGTLPGAFVLNYASTGSTSVSASFPADVHGDVKGRVYLGTTPRVVGYVTSVGFSQVYLHVSGRLVASGFGQVTFPTA